MLDRRFEVDDRQFAEELRDWEARADERARDIGEMSRERFDEQKARETLYPPTGQVVVHRKCACGAIETGVPHGGHRYACPRHPRHPESRTAA